MRDDNQILFRPFTDPVTGEINLCAVFYRHMKRSWSGVTNFAEAILWLEELIEQDPVFEIDAAVYYIKQAISIAYGRVPRLTRKAA